MGIINSANKQEVLDASPKLLVLSGGSGLLKEADGLYERGEELHEKRVYYKQVQVATQKFGVEVEDGSWVIRWCGKRKWWLIDSEGISTSDRFNAAADENVKHPHLVTTPWKVWAGMDVAEDMDLKVESAETYEKRMIAQAPPKIVVSGRSGFNAEINGTYTVGSFLHECRVFYENAQTGWAIRWFQRDKTWLFDADGLSDMPHANAELYSDTSDPTMATTHVYVFDGNESLEDSAVRIHPFDLLENVFTKAPNELVVSGRVGYNSSMNGSYKLGKFLHEGRVFYKHVSRNWVVRWYERRKQWLFDCNGLSHKPMSNAQAIEDVNDPTKVTTVWSVWDRTQFVPTPSVRVESYKVYRNRLFHHSPESIFLDCNIAMIHGIYVRERDLRDNNVYYKKQAEDRFMVYDQSLLKWVIEGSPTSNMKWIIGCQNIHNIMQPGVNIELFEDYENRILNQSPSMVVVSGRVGYNSNMNGKYIRGPHLHRGRVWYQHTQSDWVIRWYVPHRQWLFNYDGLNDRPGSNGNVSENVVDPSRVNRNWFIFNGKRFQEDPDIIVEGILEYCDRLEQYITNGLKPDYPHILPGLTKKFRDALLLYGVGCRKRSHKGINSMCEKFPYLGVSDSKEILSWLFDPSKEDIESFKDDPLTEINIIPDAPDDADGSKRTPGNNVNTPGALKSENELKKPKKRVKFASHESQRLFVNDAEPFHIGSHESLVYSVSPGDRERGPGGRRPGSRIQRAPPQQYQAPRQQYEVPRSHQMHPQFDVSPMHHQHYIPPMNQQFGIPSDHMDIELPSQSKPIQYQNQSHQSILPSNPRPHLIEMNPPHQEKPPVYLQNPPPAQHHGSDYDIDSSDSMFPPFSTTSENSSKRSSTSSDGHESLNRAFPKTTAKPEVAIENDGMSIEEPKDSGGAQFIEEFEEQMFFHEKPSDMVS